MSKSEREELQLELDRLLAKIAVIENKLMNVVETRRLEIVDENGRLRVLASVTAENASHISLIDINGCVRLELSVADSGAASVVLRNSKGEQRAEFSIDDCSQPQFVLSDSDASRSVVLAGVGESSFGLTISGKGCSESILIYLDDKGFGHIEVRDSSGAVDKALT